MNPTLDLMFELAKNKSLVKELVKDEEGRRMRWKEEENEGESSTWWAEIWRRWWGLKRFYVIKGEKDMPHVIGGCLVWVNFGWMCISGADGGATCRGMWLN